MIVQIISWLLTLALIGILIYIIAENQNPVHTLGWVIAIIFLPVIGIVLYFLVGHRPRRRKLVSDAELAKLKELTRNSRTEHITAPPDHYNRLASLMLSANHAFPMTGNSVKPYFDYYKMLDDLIADLESAEDHIHFEFFKFENDVSGRRVAEVLMRKAAEGIDVRVQYDDLANLSRKAFFRKLKAAGVKVKPFLALTLPVSQDINFRNHRKIVVIDGGTGYLGGMNIADRYGKGLNWGCWRDTHLRVQGPVVSELQTAFLCDWRFTAGELLAEERYYPPCPGHGQCLMQIVSSGPMDEWHIAMQGIVRLISNARDYVYIQSPYFVPTTPVILAMKNAALAGVDVRLMIPWKGDNGHIVSNASKSYLAEILTAGVKVWFYRRGFLHSKAVVSDDMFTTIGSTNVDVRSYLLDFEINAYLFDTGMAKIMKEAFIRDQSDSEQVDPVRWASRSKLRKFKESLARLLSPLI